MSVLKCKIKTMRALNGTYLVAETWLSKRRLISPLKEPTPRQSIKKPISKITSEPAFHFKFDLKLVSVILRNGNVLGLVWYRRD